MAAAAVQLNTRYFFDHHPSTLKQPPTTQRPTRLHHFRPTAASSTSGRKLIESGAVRPIPPKEASKAVAEEGYVLLDVRPKWEREKASVAGSVHVPLFVGDPDMGPLTLVKKWVHLGYIGLWTGQQFTMINPEFVTQVEAAVPNKEAKVLVACGEGLRSAMAVSKIYARGYKNVGWLAGGFNRSTEDDFPSVEGPEKLQYATIGGVSYIFLQLLNLLQAAGNQKQ